VERVGFRSDGSEVINKVEGDCVVSQENEEAGGVLREGSDPVGVGVARYWMDPETPDFNVGTDPDPDKILIGD